MFESLFDIVPGTRTIRLQAGEALFRMGDRASAIFKVRRGAVAMVREVADGGLLTIATANAGDTLAEASLFAEVYHCDAIARADSEVLAAPSDALRRMLESEPAMARRIAEFYAAQVRELRARLEIQRIKKADERLLAWLRWRARGAEVEAPDAWSRVASELGMSAEAIYRALRKLEEAGCIRRERRAIVLLSRGR